MQNKKIFIIDTYHSLNGNLPLAKLKEIIDDASKEVALGHWIDIELETFTDLDDNGYVNYTDTRLEGRRLETDVEYANRLKQEKKDKAAAAQRKLNKKKELAEKEKREYKEYERLKKKFEEERKEAPSISYVEKSVPRQSETAWDGGSVEDPSWFGYDNR